VRRAQKAPQEEDVLPLPASAEMLVHI
jgi:hypothetical protein